MGTGSAAPAPASALSRLTALALITLFLGLGLGPVTVARAEVDAAHASSGRQGPRMGRSGPAFLDGGFDASDVIWDDDGVDAFLRAAARSKARQKALTQDQERRRYLSSASLASYLGIQSVKAVHVPVPVNLILVGFFGEGHMGLKLDHADLVAWLEHADHVRPHARLPAPTHAARARARSRSIRTPDNAAAGSGSSPLRQSDEAPTNSVARFNFTCHVVDVGVKVTAVLERAMRLYSRPLRPVNPLGDETRLRHSRDSVAAHHVDAKAFSALVDDLVADLDLTDSYTLVLMNPRRSNMGAKYGYREGFSDDEAEFLRSKRTELLREAKRRGGTRARAPAPTTGPRSRHAEYFRAMGRRKFKSDDRSAAGDAWARKASKSLDLQEKEAYAAAKNHGSLFAHALRVLTGDDKGAARRLTAALDGAAADLDGADGSMMGDRERDAVARNDDKPASFYHSPECLVDLYVGHGRASFVDLSAGPFAWGPLVGGEGLRNVRDLPDVDLRFGGLDVSVLEALFGVGAASRAELAALHTELDAMREQRKTEDVDPKDVSATLRAELDVYSMFATKHCKDGSPPGRVGLCEDLARRTREIETALEDSSAGGIEPIVTDFSIFGDDAAATNASLAHDLFVSELVSVVSRWYSHAVAPASSAGARRYHRRVSVLVYMLSASPGSSGASGTWGGTTAGALHGQLHGGGSGFDVDGFHDELRGLMLPDQHLTVTTQRLSSSDDPALAAALLAATRSGTSPALDPVSGKVVARKVHWLDSAEVHAQLNAAAHGGSSEPRRARRRGGERSAQTDAGKKADALEIPVFVVEADVTSANPGDAAADRLHDPPTPLLIDGEHVAVSLPDMVLVAQSASRSWDSPVGCDGGDARWNLRDPTDAAVAAVAEHLGGALPSHLGYNRARRAVEHDWLWSVGNNPFSGTARGSRLSETHRDWVHRSYALTAIDASAAKVNAGVRALSRVTPCAEGWESLERWDAPAHPSSLTHVHRGVAESWMAVAEEVGRLNFADAARLGVELEQRADDFLRLSDATANAMTPLACTKRRRVPAVHWAMLAAIVVAVVAARTASPRRLKPKVN